MVRFLGGKIRGQAFIEWAIQLDAYFSATGTDRDSSVEEFVAAQGIECPGKLAGMEIE
jgi:hypothetical protein